MDWAEWEPTYLEILDDFGYDRASDERARDELSTLLAGKPSVEMGALRERLHGRDVVIAGPHAPAALPDGPLLASDAASWAFGRAGAIITDLDGDIAAQVAANARGVPLFVHAHGDNRATLAHVVPTLEGPVQGTTQASPRLPRVANYGGFTDGDRACCLAAHLGARSLTLAGFDFDAAVAKPGRESAVKARKLAWARRIIDSLQIPVRML